MLLHRFGQGLRRGLLLLQPRRIKLQPAVAGDPAANLLRAEGVDLHELLDARVPASAAGAPGRLDHRLEVRGRFLEFLVGERDLAVLEKLPLDGFLDEAFELGFFQVIQLRWKASSGSQPSVPIRRSARR